MDKKRVLCISYQFPPFAGTGVFRMLNFVEHLPELGWEPVVLSVHPGHYEKGTSLDDGLCSRVNGSMRVYKTKNFQWFESLLDLRRQFLRSIPLGGAIQVETAMPSIKTRKSVWQRVKDIVSLAYCIPDKQVGWLPYGLSEGFRICRHEKPD